MGAAADQNALAICVRETLQSNLSRHPGLQDAEVAVLELDGRTLIDVEGFGFGLMFEPAPGFDDANDEADAAKLATDAAPMLLKALKDALEALAMCQPGRGHAADCHHNAMSYGRAVIAKAEGTAA